MRTMVIALVLGSAAAVPTTSLFQASGLSVLHRANLELRWLPPIGESATDRYVTAKVKPDEIVKTVLATGTLVPALNIEVGSVLSGQVSKLRVDFNDKVKKGQVLAELDDRSYALAVDASQAALAGAKFSVQGNEAHLKRAMLDLWQAEHQLPVFQARVDSAKVLLETAEREFKRKQWLQDREVAAISDVQNAQSRRDASSSSLREAEANLVNQTGLVAAAKADVDRARADLAGSQAAESRLDALWQSATLDLERTKIRSPIDGVIVGRSITEGQTLATGLEAKTLFILAGNLDSMKIEARINESDIAGIKDGQRASFTVDAFPGRMFSAVVKQIRMAPQVLSNVVTYTVVLETANPGGILLPGMTVMANIVTSRTPGGMTVPMAALRYKPKGNLASSEPASSSRQIWALRSGKAVGVTVAKGESDGKNVVVISEDLRPDDIVIIEDKDTAKARSTIGDS